ncbi:hypothetical protein LAZ67_7000859 [Cordylochernes scorpioides]|uniref:ABC transporter domain-containing protein n=1 Tax=Cordylochernes scorpioides TaxID=51811 RepID=A0ABY6KLS7_9ARAC|nr:hypothetical protein LAZ67_7000859 [Cordylochernes scorpioides]
MALFGMVPVESGSIQIDGVDLSHVPLRLLRSHLAIIPQESVLFVGTLRSNLDPEQRLSDPELWELLEQTELKEAVSCLPKGLGSKGSLKNTNNVISQLISVVRCLARPSKILVMDEASASLSPEAEDNLIQLVNKHFSGATVLAIAMLDSVRDDPNLLQRVITGDEAWVYGYDMETKAQSSQWKLPHEPRSKKARQVRSNVKVLLTVFFDCRGVVHHEFLPQGRTVNKEYYLQVMRNLHEAIRQKRPDLWKNKNWLLHHDNSPAHTSLLVRDFLAKNNTLMMPQPPYSPDLASCDFFLFPKLKRPMKERRYATLDEIKTASKEELKKILKNDFLKCFEDWKNRWHKCIISHGDYFEGDKIGIH